MRNSVPTAWPVHDESGGSGSRPALHDERRFSLGAGPTYNPRYTNNVFMQPGPESASSPDIPYSVVTDPDAQFDPRHYPSSSYNVNIGCGWENSTNTTAPEIRPGAPEGSSLFGAESFYITSPHYSSSVISPMSPSYSFPDLTSSPESEINQLRRRVSELEQERSMIRHALEVMQGSRCGPAPSPPLSASFQASWKTRTEIRKRIFCSLNRAGNALCAWHDTRRERRKYPARHAPPGYLNCGCTYEQTLFEASLARHGVGSLLPGENVRMDPVLRNQLLTLLEERYGYKDGDFERSKNSEEWMEGESPECWEQILREEGPAHRRRQESERR